MPTTITHADLKEHLVSPPDHDAVTVAFVGGHGRSGSTLIARVLDTQPGVFLAGELHYLWDENIRADHRCGCGETFHTCPFWTEVGQQAYGGWDAVDVPEALRLRAAASRTRRAPLLASPVRPPALERDVQAYSALLAPLYRAISAVSDSPVVVDSSKLPSTGYLLRRVPGVELRMIHLIRSPFGVVHSWGSTVARQDAAPGDLFPRLPAGRVTVEWVAFNALLEVLHGMSVPTVRLRYEDFLRDPPAEIDALLAFLGRPPLEGGLVGPGHVTLAAGHSISGNQMRFQVGEIPLRLDDRWRGEMHPRTRRTVAAITAPLRWRYGYSAKSP